MNTEHTIKAYLQEIPTLTDNDLRYRLLLGEACGADADYLAALRTELARRLLV